MKNKYKDGVYLCEDLGTEDIDAKGILVFCVRKDGFWYLMPVYQAYNASLLIGNDKRFEKYAKALTYYPGIPVND